MPQADNVVYAKQAFLLTITGVVTVHLTDGQTIEGTMAAQDDLHIFIKVEEKPVLVPRDKIQFITGQQDQTIEPDDSLSRYGVAQPLLATPIAPPPEREGEREREQSVTHPYPLKSEYPPAPPQEAPPEEKQTEGGTILLSQEDDDDDDEEGTLVLSLHETQDGSRPLPIGENMPPPPPPAAEQDGTIILEPPTQHSEQTPPPSPPLTDVDEQDESEGTLILPPGLVSAPPSTEEEEEETESENPRLVCTEGPHAGEEFILDEEYLSIGRSSRNRIALVQDKEISRRHATLQTAGDSYIIEDQQSLNGTYINDRLIEAPYQLRVGDVILVGVSYLKYHQ